MGVPSSALVMIALSTVLCYQGCHAQTAWPSRCPPSPTTSSLQISQLLSCQSEPQTLRIPEDAPVGTSLVSVARQLHLKAIDSSAGKVNYLSYTGMALTLNQSAAELAKAGLTRLRFLCYSSVADSSKGIPQVVVFNLEVIAAPEAPRLLGPSPLQLSIWRHATPGTLVHIFHAKPPKGAEEAEMRFYLSSDAPEWLRLTADGGRLTLADVPPADSPSSLTLQVRVRDPLKCTESPEISVDLRIFQIWRQPKFDVQISDACGEQDNDTWLLDAVRQASQLESPIARLSIVWRGRPNLALVEAFSVKKAADSMQVRDVAVVQFDFNCRVGQLGTTARISSGPRPEEGCILHSTFKTTLIACAVICIVASAITFFMGKCSNRNNRRLYRLAMNRLNDRTTEQEQTSLF